VSAPRQRPLPSRRLHRLAKVFFAFDDHAIPWHYNTKVTLLRAEKHPANPVLRTGPPGSPDHGHAILYGSVLHIAQVPHVVLGMIERELKSGQAPGWWRPMCYAESEDGIHWTKPDLGLVEFNGNTRNNICLIESDLHSSPAWTISSPCSTSRKIRTHRGATSGVHRPSAIWGGAGRAQQDRPNESRWCSSCGATSADG